MTESAYLQRVQDMHDAYFALSVPKGDDDKQAAAWSHFRQLVLDTAHIMQVQGWGANAYYTARINLEESPTGRVIDDNYEDEVDVGLRWCCFALGHDYICDLPEEVYEGDYDEED